MSGAGEIISQYPSSGTCSLKSLWALEPAKIHNKCEIAIQSCSIVHVLHITFPYFRILNIFFPFNIITKITFSQPLSFLIEHTMMTVFMSVGDMFHQWWPFLLFHILIIPTRGSHPVTVVHWTLYPQSDVLTISLLCSQVQFIWNACVTCYK